MSGARTWRQQVKPRITPDDVRFGEFAGVVNTRSRMDLGLKALYVGDNVYLSDTKKVTRRDGYTPVRTTGTVWSAYGGTGLLYIVDNGALLHLASPTDVRVLATNLAHQPFGWDAVNDDVFYVNGVDAGIARGDVHLPWRLAIPAISNAAALTTPVVPTTFNVGQKYTQATFRILATFETLDGRESAPSEIVELAAGPLTSLIRVTLNVGGGYGRTNVYATEADGTLFRLVATTTASPIATVTFNPARGGNEYTTLNTASLPDGVTHIAFCKGRCFAGQYLPAARMSVIWISQPFGFHLWNMAKDMLPVSGEIALLLWNNKGVLIGTTTAVYQYDEESERIEQLVSYGVLPGTAGALDAQGVAYFWTTRGICRAMPFENLTEKDVSMPPGSRAVAAMLYLNGKQQFLAVTQGGGVAFNSRTERI